MARWLGVVCSGSEVKAVDAEVPASGAIEIKAELNWKLQAGDRAKAYAVLHQSMRDYIQEQKIVRVIVKASALAQGRASLAHLTAAEVRGVAIAAAAASGQVETLSKATISRFFGERSADDYVKDDEFWLKSISGRPIRSGNREAALMILSARELR